MSEQWDTPEIKAKFVITTSPDDHVVHVRRAPYWITLVAVRFERDVGSWSGAVTSVVGRTRPDKSDDHAVWRKSQLDKVPDWLTQIEIEATARFLGVNL